MKVTVGFFGLILSPTRKHIRCIMPYLQAVSATHNIAMVRKKHKMQDFDLQSYLICLCSKAVVRATELKSLLKNVNGRLCNFSVRHKSREPGNAVTINPSGNIGPQREERIVFLW